VNEKRLTVGWVPREKNLAGIFNEEYGSWSVSACTLKMKNPQALPGG